MSLIVQTPIYKEIYNGIYKGFSKGIYGVCKGISKGVYNTLFVNANAILPNLWLGNLKSAHDSRFLEENEIDIVINCTAEYPFVEAGNKKYYFDSSNSTIVSYDNNDNNKVITAVRIPVYDSKLEKDIILMEQYLKIIIPFIYREYVINKKKILIHCYAGKQRSAIVVAAFLYMYKGLSPKTIDNYHDVFQYITHKRPQAFTYGLRINFLKTFLRFFELEGE